MKTYYLSFSTGVSRMSPYETEEEVLADASEAAYQCACAVGVLDSGLHLIKTITFAQACDMRQKTVAEV